MRPGLLIGLGGVGIAAVLYYRTRDSGAAGDVLEEVQTSALRFGEATLEQLEEVSSMARRVSASVSTSTSGSRGIRNNNPGNIRKSADKWQGLSPEQTDAAFFQFVAPQWGVRALGKVLLNYRRKYGLATVRDIINRWAPPVENDTSAYVNFVARRLGVAPDAIIDVDARLPELAAAIIRHENSGTIPYTQAQIETWVRLV